MNIRERLKQLETTPRKHEKNPFLKSLIFVAVMYSVGLAIATLIMWRL